MINKYEIGNYIFRKFLRRNKKKVEKYFNTNIRLIKLENSIFEQYEIRPIKRIFIPKIWSYRIVFNKKFHFGII